MGWSLYVEGGEPLRGRHSGAGPEHINVVWGEPPSSPADAFCLGSEWLRRVEADGTASFGFARGPPPVLAFRLGERGARRRAVALTLGLVLRDLP